MIHIDELTERDRCCYRRGEMREYVRNHNPVPEESPSRTIPLGLFRAQRA